MNLFSTSKTTEELNKIKNECLNKICDYVNTSNDQNKLNMMFTEITIFRMKNDKKDGFIQNLKDLRKRKLNIEKKNLIIIQLEDIFDSLKRYNSVEFEELNKLMGIILLSEEKPKNAWEYFWSLFDKGAKKNV